jgi:hypothetical protein
VKPTRDEKWRQKERWKGRAIKTPIEKGRKDNKRIQTQIKSEKVQKTNKKAIKEEKLNINVLTYEWLVSTLSYLMLTGTIIL